MTKTTKARGSGRLRSGTTGLAVLALGLLGVLPGCGDNVLLTKFVLPWQKDAPDVKPFPTPAPKDSLVLRGNGLEQAKGFWHPRQDDLAAAKRLLEEKKIPEAEKAFHEITKDKKCPEQFREEALFYEAECQRLQTHYRGAEETYSQLVKEYPSTQFAERADRGLFEIALYWLRDTRKAMEEYDEQRQGKRWFVWPSSFIHTGLDMPVFDTEGHALRVLDGIQMREKFLHTPLGEQSLLYLGTICFYHENYLDADRHFTDLYHHYPNSDHASKALRYSIICKRLCTGGTVYDLRTVEEARKLIHTAQTAYPDFAKDTDWIQKQLVSMNLQQADRDWRVAEFYRWVGHPGPAYFYYELVRRCYPNTDYATKAIDRIAELERKHPEAVRPTAAVGALPPGGIPSVAGSPGASLPGAGLPGAGSPTSGSPGAVLPGISVPGAPAAPTQPRILPPTFGASPSS